MRILDRFVVKGSLGLWAVALVALLMVAIPTWAQAADADAGHMCFTTRKLGNCVACHYVPNVESPGDIGPNLVDVMQQYTLADRDEVFQWIWDARKFNPHTIMPPFGPNKILTKEQIENLVDYLYSLKKKD